MFFTEEAGIKDYFFDHLIHFFVELGFVVHIAFAVLVFCLTALQETQRLGALGVTGEEAQLVVLLALCAGAALILLGDLKYLLRAPKGLLYKTPSTIWTPARTVLGVILAPLILAIPLAWHGTLPSTDLFQLPLGWARDLSVFALLTALAHGLFFREAALKAFAAMPMGAVLASALAVFVFALPAGPMLATLAAASGVYLMALRLIGCHIFAVSALHAVIVIALADLGPTELDWSYVTLFTAAATVLSLLTIKIFGQIEQGDFEYA